LEPLPPIIIKGEPEYELEEIIDSPLHYNKLQYRAKWTGYSPGHDKTWYLANNLENGDLARRSLYSCYPDKPHLNHALGTGQRRHTRLDLTSTEPGGSPSSTTKDTDLSGKLGNNHWLV